MGSLDQFQRSVIIGCLLGDGYIRQIPGRRDAFLEINHSFSQHEYVDWKYLVLSNISGNAPKKRKGSEGRVAYRFYTKQNPEITDLMKLWYVNKMKTIPLDIELNSISLAVWYMDDGSKCSESDFYLNTQQFDLSSQIILIKKLREMGLSAKLNKDKKYRRIRFLKSSIPELKRIIHKHIIPSMEYKLIHDPVETTRRSPVFLKEKRTG